MPQNKNVKSGPGPADLTETELASEAVFDGKLLHVRRDRVRLPDGKEATREYIEHPGAVTIVAVLDSGELVMERQYRYPLRDHVLELPAGKIDKSEEPLATAKRELLEETGYTAREWHYLATIHPLVAYSDERIFVYLARGLALQARKLDEGEFLEVLHMPLEELLALVRAGTITDVKTIIGVLWLEKIAKGEWAAE